MQNSCHPFFLVTIFLRTLLMAGISLIAFPVHATEIETEEMQTLKQRIILFYTQKAQQKQFKDIHVQIRNLPTQLRLQKCQRPLTLEDPTLTKTGKIAGRHTLKIYCPTPKWKIYLSTYVTGTVPAVATTKVILRNAVIHPADVKQIWLPAQQAALNRVTQIATAIGMRAKRNLRAHKILTAKDLTPPYWVFKKNEITLVTRLNGLTVKAKGIALQNGVQGQQINVKNKHSGRTLKGIVTAPNTVEIP